MRSLFLVLVLCAACGGRSVSRDDDGRAGTGTRNGARNPPTAGTAAGATGGATGAGGTSGNGVSFTCGPTDPELVELYEKYCITCTCDANNVENCEQCDVTCELEGGAWLEVGSGLTMADGCTVCSCTAYGLECDSSACSRTPHPRIPI